MDASAETGELPRLEGYTDDRALRRGLRDARFAFPRKPFTPDTLARKVREALDAPRA